MKAIVAVAVVFLAAMPSMRAYAQADNTGSNADVDPRITAYKDHNNPENIADGLRQQGKCGEAVPIYRSLVSAQDRYEETQYHLAACLFAIAKVEHDSKQAQALNSEGAEWILRGADAGVEKAQALAVQLYLDGRGVAVDPVEAGKWAYIFHDNGNRLALGEPDLAPAVRGQLDAVLTGDKRKQAQARANSWTPSGEQAEP